MYWPTPPRTILLNTCSIRDNAEQKIVSRLQYLASLRRRRHGRLIIGDIGCMAERVKDSLINNHGVDLVAGPDSYLDLPNLFASAEAGEKAINVELSTTETYRDIVPSRITGNRVSGFVSIMRGCNNFCSYCIVPPSWARTSTPINMKVRKRPDIPPQGARPWISRACWNSWPWLCPICASGSPPPIPKT